MFPFQGSRVLGFQSNTKSNPNWIFRVYFGLEGKPFLSRIFLKKNIPEKFRTGLLGPVRFLRMRWFLFSRLLRDSWLELPFGWFEEAEDEDAPFPGADTRRDAFSKDEELPLSALYGVSGLYYFLFPKHERNETVEDFFREVFSKAADVDVFSHAEGATLSGYEYAGETDGEACDDFLSSGKLGEVDNFPSVSRSSGNARNVVISGHEGFLSRKLKKSCLYSRMFFVSGQAP